MSCNTTEIRKQNTDKRHQIVKDEVNSLYSQTLHGIRLDYDDVLEKVAAKLGYSPRTVKNILKA